MRGCNNLKGFKNITVVPSEPCSITAIPSNNVFTGGVATNLFIGYGPQQLILKVNAPESGAPYTYKWSGGNLSQNNTAAPVFTASESGRFTFTVEVTNKNGCVSTCSITVCVTDIRVPGSNGHLVYACVAPFGNASFAKTAPVITQAIPLLFRYNSIVKLGKCGESCDLITKTNGKSTTEATGELTAIVFPNPSRQSFTLQLRSDKFENVHVKVMDLQGRILLNRSNVAQGSLSFGDNYPGGIYIVEVIQGNRRELIRLVKQ